MRRPAGRLHGLLNAAVQNVAIERGADAEEAKAESDALRSKLLGRLNTIDTSPVDPQQIKSEGIDVSTPTGSRLIHRYNITKALIESGQLKLEDLPTELRTNEPTPRLRSPAEFPSDSYDAMSDAYHRSNESVPGVGDMQETYLSEFSAQEAGISEAYAADNPKELKTKLKIG